MAEENQQRRVKATGEATHRKGTLRGAVKPHKRVTEVNISEIVSTYTSSLRQGSTSQCFWGNTVAKNAAGLRTNFGLASDDEPYFILDVSGKGTGNMGLLVSKQGAHLADGKGNSVHFTWKEFDSAKLNYRRGALIIGQNKLTSPDAQVVYGLLQQIQAMIV